MISEFSVKPKAKNKLAHFIFWGFVAVALGILAVYAFMDSYRGFVGLGAILMFAGAVYIFSKYIGIEYVYEISFSQDGVPLFLVRQNVGKRTSLMCNITLSSIRAVKHESREERRKYVSLKGTERYIFTPTVMPPEVYRIISAEEGKRIEIVIECSEDFAALLLSYSAEARTLYPEDDEE